MPTVTEMSLPFLPAEQLDFAADPMPYVEEARRRHPWLAKCEAGYLVHGYEAVKDILYMDAKLGPARSNIVEIYGAQGTPWAAYMEEMLLNQRGAEHARLRNSVALAFTPRNVNRYRLLMRGIASRLLDEWAPRGQFDFVEFAAEFPIRVLCGILGVPGDDIPPEIREALEAQASSLSLNRDLLPVMLNGYHLQWDFVDRLVRDREARGGLAEEALLDAMIIAKDGGAISDRELRHLLMVLFPAGYDTSKNMLSMTMFHMLDRPTDWARCAEDSAFCVRVVEEMFRHSAVTTPYRTVAEDFEYDGVRFTRGTLLIFATLLAGRDPAAYEKPMEFDPERPRDSRHVGFGRGAHICLGQHLARAQLEEGLNVIAQRITRPKLAGEVTWRRFLGVWGPRSLPITFEPA